MGAISVDSEGYAAQEGRISPKAIGTAAILAGALAVAGVGIYWLATEPTSVRNETPAAASPERPANAEPAAASVAPAEAEPLVAAPAPTCVDGRPASDDVPADACL
jgi:hypothetical protein